MLDLLSNSYLSMIFDWVIETSITASILVGFILCIKVLLRNQLTARWHYALWLILILKLMLPWAPESSFSLYSIISRGSDLSYSSLQDTTKEQFSNESNELKTHPKVHNQTKKEMASQDPNDSTWHVSMHDIFLCIWLLGIFCLSSFVIIVNKRLYVYLSRQPFITDKRVIRIFESCKEEMSIQQDIPLLIAGKISSPTLLGFQKPRILLCEKHIEQLDDNQIRFIFYHELSHFKRKDVGVNWLMYSLLILNWFNPILWYAYYAMREDQEIACDALALTFISSKEKIAYGHTIITLLEHYSNHYQTPGLANLSRNKHTLKRRIIMIKKFNKKSYRWSVLGIATVIGISTFSLMDAKAAEPSNEKGNKIEHEQTIKQGSKPVSENPHFKSTGTQGSKPVSENPNFKSNKAQSTDTPERTEVFKLSEPQKQALKDSGLPIKQTSEEAKSTGLILVYFVKSVDKNESQSKLVGKVNIIGTGKVDVIKQDEYQKKYGDMHYTSFSAWE
ncbi:M56 family metallopeptidase [Bacillus paramycoides]|uniref:M56 family metallopeptidase n=1 Tax=Bacillus paramycoides TaxID=2026194 RepID=UPI003D02D687